MPDQSLHGSSRSIRIAAGAIVLGALLAGALASAADPPKVTATADEAQAIAHEAYVYGFPMVDNYRVLYSYVIDRDSPEFKAPWNTIRSDARVYTPEDKAIQTPNSDTPYSMLGVDLRAEPLVLTVPAIEKNRYYSLQFVDLYTFNYAYVGSRATGNEAGSFLLAGPSWKGEKPPGIKDVIRSETELGLVIYRTQLFDPADIDNVKKVQAGYKVEPLSAFLGQPPPPAAAKIDFIKPLTPDQQRSSPEFFEILSFVLQFCPTHSSEKGLRERFAKLGIGAPGGFEADTLSADIRKNVEIGMADAWRVFGEFKETQLDTDKRTSGDLFGTRQFLKGRYMDRMAGAILGIYGNSKAEAMYPVYAVDSDGQKLDASTNRYTLRLAAGALPPVHAFWSLTMYELPSSLLVANPLGRYLINSPMLPNLQRDADGGLTIYVQNESPGKDRESNWLPAPKGPFMAVLRLYWPDEKALSGQWKAPPMERAKDGK